MLFRAIVMALFLTAAGCATSSRAPPRPNVYVMRHLHTLQGVTNADLTSEGQRFALLASDWFRRDPPDVIYVSSTNRSRQTVAPLAERLRLRPKTYNPAGTPALVASIMQEHGTVLVVGHSNTVPDIIAGLGGQRPPELSHEEFGDVWHVAGPHRLTTHAKIGE
jgi:broad specificity phosphatase PhoE